MNYEWNWQEAEREFQRAIILNPHYAPARQWHAWLLVLGGRGAEAVAEIETAKQLDPFSLGINWFRSAVYCLAGKLPEAVAAARQLIEIEPNFWAGHWALAVAEENAGNIRAAIESYEQSARLDFTAMASAALARAFALDGKEKRARELVAELERRAAIEYVPPYYFALIYESLGDQDRALAFLQESYEKRDGSLPLLKVDARLRSLRGDARFEVLLKEIGLAN